ncbi:uncharacterized protein [Halyomorpha halys]
MVRLVRAVSPNDNSSKIDEVESDLEEDEEFEDTASMGSTEEQYEAEVYDNVHHANREKVIDVSDRSKRHTINAKKGTASSVPDLIEIGEDESLNENDGENYSDFLPTRKESITLRSRERKMGSKGIAYREVPSLSAKNSKVVRAKDNKNMIASDTLMPMKSVLHGKKGKLPKNKEKNKNLLKNGGESDFDELKKAYNALVCSVENFMGLANKTLINSGEDNCAGSRNLVTTVCEILPTAALYGKNDSLQSTFDFCGTKKMECVTTCDDSDLDSAEHHKKSDDDDDISSMKKKNKGMKVEYPTQDDTVEKSGAYVYNDYDSVDPNEYDTNVPVKSTMLSPSLISRSNRSSSTFQMTDSGKTEKYKDHSKKVLSSTVIDSTITKDLSTTSYSKSGKDLSTNSYTTSDATKESTITWTTFRYEPKIKVRPSRRQSRRMSTEFQKILSRRKYHYTRHRDQKNAPKEGIARSRVTPYPILKNMPRNHDGDTEIIEVEYI